MIIRKNERIESITFGSLYPGDAFYKKSTTSPPLMKMTQCGPGTPNAVSLDDGLTYRFNDEDCVDFIENIEIVIG